MAPVFPFHTATGRIALTAVAVHLAVTVILAEESGSAANGAKNLARVNCGARISWISNQGTQSFDASCPPDPATTLILDDNTLNCELSKGDNAFLITLPNISNLDRLTFINERADLTGTVQVFVSDYRLSPNDTWTPIGRPAAIGNERFVGVSLAGVEAKYVKVVFKTDKAGTIAGVGIYGQRTLASFADQQHRAKSVAAKIAYAALKTSADDNLNFNFANLYARAEVVWVSSGSKNQANRMIDDDPTTGFDFAPDDAQPTVIVELHGNERIRRVSAVYETQRGRLDIYLLNALSDPAVLHNLKPVVSIADSVGAGKAAAEFDPRGTRYIALRWTPAQRRLVGKKFKIAEIGAFSDAAPTIFDVQGIPELANTTIALSIPKEPPTLVPTSP